MTASAVLFLLVGLPGSSKTTRARELERTIDMSDLDAVTDEVWDAIFAVNVKGIFYCSRAVAPHMRARGDGAIVNVTSVAGLTGGGSSLPYAVSKAAASGLTRSLAPQIRVCSVAPGLIETRWNEGRDEHVQPGRTCSSAA